MEEAELFDFKPDEDAGELATPERYRQLARAADALTEGEDDAVANMANIAALIWEFVPDLNWAGFYRVVGEELVLGPFIGRPACIRIAMGAGVCGSAASEQRSQLVPDVTAFPGHIACDAQTGRNWWSPSCTRIARSRSSISTVPRAIGSGPRTRPGSRRWPRSWPRGSPRNPIAPARPVSGQRAKQRSAAVLKRLRNR